MQIEQAELQAIPGVGAALAKGIIERFPTWEALAEADEESLGSMRGLRKDALESVKTLAGAQVRAEELQNATELHEDFEEKAVAQKSDEAEDAPKYVMQVKPLGKIDPHTVIRRRVKLTLAVCEQCGWDAVEKFRLRPYDQLPPGEQARVRADVQKHKQLFHGVAQVITEEQFKAERKGRRFGVVEA